MASEDFFVFLSVVFKKFGFILNEFLPIVDCLFHYSHNLWLLGIPNDRFWIKKVFFLFLPSHPHKYGSNALFIGVSRVRVSVRVELLPSHLPSHFPHTSGTGKYPVRVSIYRI